MSDRYLPLHPNLDQLKHQAKDLLRNITSDDPTAVAEFQTHHPERIEPRTATLADAQLVLARAYAIASWPRLVLACRMIDAIWRDDVSTVRALVIQHPNLVHEMASGTEQHNWGPPMTFAANLGRDRIVDALHDLGALDLKPALGRAVLQSQIDTARKLHGWLGRPRPPLEAL